MPYNLCNLALVCCIFYSCCSKQMFYQSILKHINARGVSISTFATKSDVQATTKFWHLSKKKTKKKNRNSTTKLIELSAHHYKRDKGLVFAASQLLMGTAVRDHANRSRLRAIKAHQIPQRTATEGNQNNHDDLTLSYLKISDKLRLVTLGYRVTYLFW